MEKRHIVYFVLVLIMLSGLAACVPANAADKPTPVPMSTLDAVLTPEDTTMPEETAPAEDVSTLLAEMAKADLAQRLGVDLDQIVVERVTPTEFSDTSLGVPEPGQMYAQVITPGYVITLTVDGESYRYHGAGERVVIAVPSEKDVPPTGDIAIEGVNVNAERIAVRGTSTLPEGTCLNTELWADGVPQPWWPVDTCAKVKGGDWVLEVPLDVDQTLEAGVQYMVRACLPGGPNTVSTFPFDLSGPPGPPSEPPAGDPALLLPDSGEVLHRASADLNGDGRTEEIILAGWGGSPDRLGYDFLQMFVIAPGDEGAYAIAWQSEQLPTERAEALEVQDVNGDGLPEVLSVQAMGASGERLYVLAWLGESYGWLLPQGGRFDGQDAFGENGARVADVDGDGLFEILASYGPSAAQTDVYGWDGQAYVYQRTMGSEEAGYVRVSLAEAGLSLDVPAAWTEIAPATWAASEESPWRLGVRWVDLAPPQEPEAALLPQPAQILASEPVELAWVSGRRFTVEVYGEAEEGVGQAQVQSVETHVLVVVERDGGRRAYDITVSAPDAQRLRNLESTLQRALTSVVLE